MATEPVGGGDGMMKVLIWIAGGLTVTTMVGVGAGNAFYNLQTVPLVAATAGSAVQDPGAGSQVQREERIRMEIERLMMAQQRVLEQQQFDVERIIQELENIDIPDIEQLIPEIDIEIPELPEIDLYRDMIVGMHGARFPGLMQELELLEMTYQQQVDPGLTTFNEAKLLLFEEKYRDARVRFLELIQKYADSGYVDDAAFWACVALERMTDQMENALKEYEEFIQQYSGSPFTEHAYANMIRLAGRLYNQGFEEYRELIEEAEQGSEDEIRLYALNALVGRKDADVVSIVEGVLADKSASSRLKREAIELLRRTEDQKAVQVLEGVAREHDDPEVRRSAILTLGARREKASFDVLVSLYSIEKSINGRRYIAIAAGPMRKTSHAAEVAAFLAGMVENDDAIEVKRQALGELTGFESEVSQPHLIRLMSLIEDPDLRRQMIYHLSVSEYSGIIRMLVDEISKSDNEQLREDVIRYLGRIRDPGKIEVLRSIVNSDLSQKIRAAAVAEMGHIEGTSLTSELIEIVQDKNAPSIVRHQALIELRSRQTEEVFEVIKDIALNSENRSLRQEAVTLLRRGWEKEAIPVLEEAALNDPEVNMRRNAVRSLGRFEGGVSWDALVGIYNNSSDPDCRILVLDSIWRIDEERSLDTVISAAKSDSDTGVRLHAVKILGRSDSEKAKEALKEILNIPPVI